MSSSSSSWWPFSGERLRPSSLLPEQGNSPGAGKNQVMRTGFCVEICLFYNHGTCRCGSSLLVQRKTQHAYQGEGFILVGPRHHHTHTLTLTQIPPVTTFFAEPRGAGSAARRAAGRRRPRLGPLTHILGSRWLDGPVLHLQFLKVLINGSARVLGIVRVV